MSAPLSPELKGKYGIRSLPIRKGDKVRIIRGDYRGTEGEVLSVFRKKYRIAIKGLTRKKTDGTEIPIPIHPSKVVITKPNLGDNARKDILERRGVEVEEIEEEEAEKVEEPSEEEVEESQEEPTEEEINKNGTEEDEYGKDRRKQAP